MSPEESLLQSEIQTTYVNSYIQTEKRLFSTCDFLDWSAHTKNWNLEQKLAFIQKSIAINQRYGVYVRQKALEGIHGDTEVPELTHVGLLNASAFWDNYVTNEVDITTAKVFGESRLKELDGMIQAQTQERIV